MRNHGIGLTMMKDLIELVKKPIILEILPTVDEISKKRLEFYRRFGAKILINQYYKPNYFIPGEITNMILMCIGNPPSLNEILRNIYENTYERPDLINTMMVKSLS